MSIAFSLTLMSGVIPDSLVMIRISLGDLDYWL